MILGNEDFNRLKKFMQYNYGINLENKHALIEARLSNYLGVQNYVSFNSYINSVLNDKTGAMAELLVEKLTTNYTYFMREDLHYRFLADVVLPEWLPQIADKDLRIWSAGCASGEEAYTAAMIFHEYLGLQKSLWDTSVLATDISLKVLAEAKQGVYDESRLKCLPEAWKTRYFTREGQDKYKVKKILAQDVSFARFNLMDDFSRFKRRFHIVFCRNVMIYFDTKSKEGLIRKFCDVLEPSGYFFVGLSEGLPNLLAGFEYVSTGVYKRRAD